MIILFLKKKRKENKEKTLTMLARVMVLLCFRDDYIWGQTWFFLGLFPWDFRPFKRAASHTRLRARDCYTSSTLVGGKGGAGPSSPHTTLDGPTEYVDARWTVKSTRICTWHWMDHVSWSLGLFSKNHLSEVGLTQNREIMALQMLTTVGLLCFIMCEDMHE